MASPVTLRLPNSLQVLKRLCKTGHQWSPVAPVLANPPDKLVVVDPTILIGIGLVSPCFTVRQYSLWVFMVFALLKTTYYIVLFAL